MPVRQITRKKTSESERELLEKLLIEWRATDSRAQQPVILEEREGPGKPVHIYVIWDDWARLSGIERSEIIMDAYEQHYGHDAALDVTVAMGLTPVEADRMGIK